MRNRLSALSSSAGAFGFTCGVEWLATEKLEVHQARGLNWGAERNIVDELAALDRLVADHPCFHADAVVSRLSPDGSPLLALRRDSSGEAGQRESVLVLVNLDLEAKHDIRIDGGTMRDMGSPSIDLLGQDAPAVIPQGDGTFTVGLGPGEAYCLASSAVPNGLAGDAYRAARAQAAFALTALTAVLPPEGVGPAAWTDLARRVAEDPLRLVAAVARIDRTLARQDLLAALDAAAAGEDRPPVIALSARDVARITPVPPGSWLLVRDAAPFAATLHRADAARAERVRSVPVANGHVVAFPPGGAAGEIGRAHV
jgi:hypothetical protein